MSTISLLEKQITDVTQLMHRLESTVTVGIEMQVEIYDEVHRLLQLIEEHLEDNYVL